MAATTTRRFTGSPRAGPGSWRHPVTTKDGHRVGRAAVDPDLVVQMCTRRPGGDDMAGETGGADHLPGTHLLPDGDDAAGQMPVPDGRACRAVDGDHDKIAVA